jgi:hypothetical protein
MLRLPHRTHSVVSGGIRTMACTRSGRPVNNGPPTITPRLRLLEALRSERML